MGCSSWDQSIFYVSNAFFNCFFSFFLHFLFLGLDVQAICIHFTVPLWFYKQKRHFYILVHPNHLSMTNAVFYWQWGQLLKGQLVKISLFFFSSSLSWKKKGFFCWIKSSQVLNTEWWKIYIWLYLYFFFPKAHIVTWSQITAPHRQKGQQYKQQPQLRDSDCCMTLENFNYCLSSAMNRPSKVR